MDSPVVRSSSRLEAYSDAIFSIIATVMVVPIAHTEIPHDVPLGDSFLHLLLPKLFVYLYTFMLVSYAWTQHVWLFEAVEKVDEFIVLLNLAVMMVITFMPFTFTLTGAFPQHMVAILIFAGSLVILFSIQVLFVVYVFHKPEILREELRDEDNLKKQRTMMLFSIVTPLVLALAALVLAPASTGLATVLLMMLLFTNMIRTLLVKWYRKCRGKEQTESLDEYRGTPLRSRLLLDTISKERVECFSDGVFAIVATLIILDICEKNIPTQKMVDDAGGHLSKALYEYASTYLAYSGSFMTVALQWYVHHSLLHYIKSMNKAMVLFNHLCLMCIGLTPLAFTLTSDQDMNESYQHNETHAIQINCVVIFLASFFQVAVWVTALFSQQRHLVEEAGHGGKDHAYMMAKLTVYPILSLMMYFITFSNEDIKVYAFVTMQLCAILFFILLSALFYKIRTWVQLQTGPFRLEASPTPSPDIL